jgi:hypothetical protein
LIQGYWEGEERVDYQIVEKNNNKYIRLNPVGNLIQTESDGLELISLCSEYGTNLLLIPAERLSDEFFRLSTGLAGAIVQKFVQYGVKAAIVLDQDSITGRFRDFLAESNRGNLFRAYAGFEEAETWLLGGS